MMELKDSLGRNINIAEEVRERYNNINAGFAFKDLDAKYIFMLSLALAHSQKLERKPLKKRHPGLNTNSFSEEDIWLMASIAVQENGGDISVLGNPGEIKKICEEYAMAGLDVLERLMDENGSGDNFVMTIEKMGKEKIN